MEELDRIFDSFFKLVALIVVVFGLVLVSALMVHADNRPAVPIHLVSVENPYADHKIQNRAMRRAIEYWRSYGVRMNLRKFEKRPDPFKSIRNEGSFLSFGQEFSAWFDVMIGENKIRPGQATHVVAPPWGIDGRNFIGGWAFLGFLRSGAFSYSNCDLWSVGQGVTPRYCTVIMAHELGHSVLGCDHEILAVPVKPRNNIMHPNATTEQFIADVKNGDASGRLLPPAYECKEKIKKFNARSAKR